MEQKANRKTKLYIVCAKLYSFDEKIYIYNSCFERRKNCCGSKGEILQSRSNILSLNLEEKNNKAFFKTSTQPRRKKAIQVYTSFSLGSLILPLR